MKTIIALCCLMSITRASLVAFVPIVSQYHNQDTLGQYSYGYSGGPSAKHEVKTADGITQGSYSYIDANNILQSVSYVSDPVNGFRVAATNLPQGPTAPVAIVSHETPEVAAAKTAHLETHTAIKSESNLRKRRSVLPVIVAPVISTQYQTQDSFGQYTYGYNDGLSAKAEARSIDGITTGGYSYLDANGIVQTVQYIADANGFRTTATNIPVAPTPVATVAPVAAPVVIDGPVETPEVAAAKAAHFAAHEEAKARLDKV